MKALVQYILNATAAGKAWLLAADSAAQKALLSLTKSDVGLGNVDNTSDASKPVSSAQAAALSGKANTTHTHAQSDVTGLVSALAAKADLVGGLVPSSQLPSYVDDVIEAANLAAFPATGESSKIYVALDTGKTYRWSGSAYVELTDATAVWGSISGTLSNQTDLFTALNAKIGGSVGTTDSRLVKSSGTGGSTIQSTGITVDASNNVSGVGTISSGAITAPVYYYPNTTTPAYPSSGMVAFCPGSADWNLRSPYGEAYIQIGGSSATNVSSFGTMMVGGTGGVRLQSNPQASGPSVFLKVPSTSVLKFRNTADSADIDLTAGAITASGLMCPGVYTVATLPSASANASKFAVVTDSSVTANGSNVASGGANRVMVFSNGTNWKVIVA